jgi:mono/diheme cytochrome c family protein
MNKYVAIGIIALLIVVAALPVYALLEPYRMDVAQASLRQRFVAEGAGLYVANCVHCHGVDGGGIGPMPALNNPALATVDREVLYDTIAHSPHGTAMAAWHVDEGGILSGYQVEGLVSLITNADWGRVEALAAKHRVVIPTPVAPMEELATMEASTGEVLDPHECRACHEEPAVHADRFGLNCSRCHTLQAWKPAQLTRHVFYLDHGDGGKLACQTCHTESYAGHTCYGCHDHDPGEMQAAHATEEIYAYDNCAECHPTGEAGEAARLGYGLSGQASNAGDNGRGGGTLDLDANTGLPAQGTGTNSTQGSAHGDRETAPGYTAPEAGGDAAGENAGSDTGAGITTPTNTEAGGDTHTGQSQGVDPVPNRGEDRPGAGEPRAEGDR